MKTAVRKRISVRSFQEKALSVEDRTDLSRNSHVPHWDQEREKTGTGYFLTAVLRTALLRLKPDRIVMHWKCSGLHPVRPTDSRGQL